MLTPLKSIRAKCLDCSCGSFTEVEHCPIERCPIYPYRMGKNPNRTGIGNHSAKPPVANLSRTHGPISAPNPAIQGTDTTPPNSRKKTAPGEATTQDGKMEQTERTVSTAILPHRKDIVKA